MEYSQLKYFQAVAKTENISRAANELYVTQPNLSKSISRLEKEIGVPLFDHRKGKIVLNDYGRIFLTSVNSCFDELSKGVSTIKKLYDTNQNYLLLGSSINDFLPDLLVDFASIHPEIGIRQIECSLKDIGSRILAGEIEIGITSKPLDDSLFKFDLMGEKEFVILTGPTHHLADKKEISIKELSDEAFICDSSRMDRDRLNDICQKNGFEPNIAFDVENSDLIYSLLTSNSYVCFMPSAQIVKIKRDYPSSNIHMINITDELPPAIIGITYKKDYIFSNAAKIFADFAHEWISREHIETMKIISTFCS
ncbi:MAG: LysR family transcriptional regulator [Eubacterium sp.]|nr:LysR family transcriptional regulator [Eubacterium sp.]